MMAALMRRYEDQWSEGQYSVELEKNISDELLLLLALTFTAGSGIAAGELGFDLDPRGAAGTWSRTYSQWLGRYTANKVADAAQRIRALRTDIDAIDKAVTDLKLQYGAPRFWERLAGTETTRAAVAGGEFSAGVFRATKGRSALAIWRNEKKPCPVCKAMNGLERRIWTLYFPLGPPSPHPNCRCWIDYVDPEL